MTLRTFADVADAVGLKVRLKVTQDVMFLANMRPQTSVPASRWEHADVSEWDVKSFKTSKRTGTEEPEGVAA